MVGLEDSLIKTFGHSQSTSCMSRYSGRTWRLCHRDCLETTDYRLLGVPPPTHPLLRKEGAAYWFECFCQFSDSVILIHSYKISWLTGVSGEGCNGGEICVGHTCKGEIPVAGFGLGVKEASPSLGGLLGARV